MSKLFLEEEIRKRIDECILKKEELKEFFKTNRPSLTSKAKEKIGEVKNLHYDLIKDSKRSGFVVLSVRTYGLKSEKFIKEAIYRAGGVIIDEDDWEEVFIPPSGIESLEKIKSVPTYTACTEGISHTFIELSKDLGWLLYVDDKTRGELHAITKPKISAIYKFASDVIGDYDDSEYYYGKDGILV